MSEYAKPLPFPTVESEPFWEGCKRHELLLPQCRQCSKYWFPPGSTCPNCWSAEWDWRKASGRGTIYSFGVYHRAYHPGFEDEIPYVFAIVQLEEGPRLISNVMHEPSAKLQCDTPVEVVFDDVTDEVTLYKFKPIS